MNANRSALEQLKIERKPESPRRSKGWLLVFCILALVAATAAVAWMRPRVPEVKTVQVKAMVGSGATEATVLNASGYVTARRKATISAKITGKIVEVLVEEGLTVKSNQVLARLDDSNVRRALAVAQASLESARLNLDETRALLKQADREYTRTTELAKARIASQSDLDKAESDAVSLRARLVRQPIQDGGFRRGSQCLGQHVGIKNDHVSKFTGSRMASRGATSNSTPPSGSIRARMESTRVPIRERSIDSAVRRMSRASSSMERP